MLKNLFEAATVSDAGAQAKLREGSACLNDAAVKDDDLVSVARGSSETWRQLPNTIAMESGSNLSNLRIMVGERTLTGAVVMGDQKLSLPLQEMISSGRDISPIRDQLLQPGAPLGDLVMDFWSASKVGSRI